MSWYMNYMDVSDRKGFSQTYKWSYNYHDNINEL